MKKRGGVMFNRNPVFLGGVPLQTAADNKAPAVWVTPELRRYVRQPLESSKSLTGFDEEVVLKAYQREYMRNR